MLGFACGSTGKESTCNERDLGSISGVGGSPGEGKTTHSSILLAWRIPWTIVHGIANSQTQLSNFHFHFLNPCQNFRVGWNLGDLIPPAHSFY